MPITHICRKLRALKSLEDLIFFKKKNTKEIFGLKKIKMGR